ncbi:TIGR04283 family arsenosugar biosynthesis glycosyltransferase [Daejeonella sp.]|uniref:TIGR04283 family arsenosugar biosynthesis glycosyltransferase n=1 Tax=Daejeonella sp. TaxID=2805397 RepID=UPI0030BE2C6C
MISVIIPAYNEASQIAQTIDAARRSAAGGELEIIVVDGGSADETADVAVHAGAKVLRSGKGRAVQMNYGAAQANGSILYFLHADSMPPVNYDRQILNAVKYGAVAGCFRMLFDDKHWFLMANAWFTRFDANAVRFGDQSLFVLKNAFGRSGGFREDLLMMEDQEIIHRIKREGTFIVLKDYVTTSARKYVDNGPYRMQGIFYLIWTLYYFGWSQESLLKLHRKLIRKNKL